jgi:hypothetical protein
MSMVEGRYTPIRDSESPRDKKFICSRGGGAKLLLRVSSSIASSSNNGSSPLLPGISYCLDSAVDFNITLSE